MQNHAFDLWLDKPAPRYTSYPAAPHFVPQVGAEDYRASLRAHAGTNAPVSLYIHIPFCQSLCLYCGCNTTVTNSHSRIDYYINAVLDEARMTASIIGRARISRLHFGGGTPNILPAHVMQKLFAGLREFFDFSEVAEIAMELDPRIVTREQVPLLAACGVTRVSLGAQDFNPAVQQLVHRTQPFEKVAAVCAWVRESGITHINFDLMYGLPHQTPQSIAKTTEMAVALAPSRIALFSYAHVPQFKPHQNALTRHGIPQGAERLALDTAARRVLSEAGYVAIGIDHFTRPDDSLATLQREGRLRRNFQGYTDDEAPLLLGLGASSISQTPEGYFQNARDERPYEQAILGETFPIQRGFLLTPHDKLRGAIIERLMCDLRCDARALATSFAIPFETLNDAFHALGRYEAAGLIQISDGAIKLTSAYPMAIRMIASCFDNYQRQATIPSSRVA